MSLSHTPTTTTTTFLPPPPSSRLIISLLLTTSFCKSIIHFCIIAPSFTLTPNQLSNTAQPYCFCFCLSLSVFAYLSTFVQLIVPLARNTPSCPHSYLLDAAHFRCTHRSLEFLLKLSRHLHNVLGSLRGHPVTRPVDLANCKTETAITPPTRKIFHGKEIECQDTHTFALSSGDH